MITKITDGVKVSVFTYYQKEYSDSSISDFLFAYKIVIENKTDFTLQLLRRHWFVHDSNGSLKEVEGEGVVGQQPVLEPHEKYEYVSGCHLKSEIGKMVGTYLMERQIDKKQFLIHIPEFILIAPHKLN